MRVKKYITKSLLIGTLVLGAMPSFATVYGVVDRNTGAYTEEGIKILELTKGMDVIVSDLHSTENHFGVTAYGIEGYVEGDDINIRKVRGQVCAAQGYFREGADPTATILKKLPKGQVINIMAHDGNWFEVILEDGTKGYMYKSQIQGEGLDLLPNKKLRKSPVEVLQWSEASRVLPRGGVATIEDIYTGKTFKIKRTFGTNHADVEALTAADTQRIKDIWGGFSWERHPVIVHVNGRQLAASLAAMPHAGDSLDAVRGNGMSGVMDLHFRGSRRHKEGNIQAVVDPQHQKAIDIAASYKNK